MMNLKTPCEKCGEPTRASGVWITMKNSAIVLFECERCDYVWTEIHDPDYSISEIGRIDTLAAFK